MCVCVCVCVNISFISKYILFKFMHLIYTTGYRFGIMILFICIFILMQTKGFIWSEIEEKIF